MLYESTIPQFIKMLNNLNLILDKASAHADAKKIDFNVFLTSRLFPDQFNLSKQIQIACDTAKLGGARLAGKEAPAHVDTDQNLSELKARISDVIHFLNSISESDFKEADTRKISQPRWAGKFLTGKEFAIQHAIPNLYFHVTTAYAILRHNGIDVGKKDYLGEMPYKQPE